jgi:hypothetical protein
VQSLYGVLNDGGIKHIFTLVVWKLQVPLRIHIFLWLLIKNKILTRDNLMKRKNLDDVTCLFCTELESVRHLFFECCVAQSIWETISEMLGFQVGSDFESVAKLWLSDKKYKYVNVLNAIVLWSLWNTRNNLCFQFPSGWGRGGFWPCVRAHSEVGACCSRNLVPWNGGQTSWKGEASGR